MAQIDLNLGTSANSNDGDTLRDAMQTIQTNTTELFAKGVTPVFATLNDLPSASDHHGMFAHVHATGSAYFAHAGSWIKIQAQVTPKVVTKNASNVFVIDLSENINFTLEASGVWAMTVTAAADQVGQAGNIIIKNTAVTTPASLPSNLKTPNGSTIAWETDSGDVAIISYFVVDTSTILVNYIGNFS